MNKVFGHVNKGFGHTNKAHVYGLHAVFTWFLKQITIGMYSGTSRNLPSLCMCE